MYWQFFSEHNEIIERRSCTTVHINSNFMDSRIAEGLWGGKGKGKKLLDWKKAVQYKAAMHTFTRALDNREVVQEKVMTPWDSGA